ncbi:MAG: diaminopimelate decarboxylase, partial [Clostridia bacterium]|nr:diaminopimelate decarboxylase [Clostridia bacterium]
MNTQLLHNNYSINDKGHFEVCGHDTVLLAEKYGTPLYVIDEDKVREMCRTYKNAVEKYFDNADILYASKALSFKGMYKIAAEEGMCVDAV